MVNIIEQEKKHLPISSRKSNSRLKHIEIKSQKVEGMELGTNNNDDKRFGQPSIILLNVKDFHYSHAHVPCLQRTCTFKSSQLCKMGRNKTNQKRVLDI
jgi:hypothetical protein